MTTTVSAAGAFSDARRIIADAFKVAPKGKGLRQLCAQLNRAPIPPANYPALVADLYSSIARRCEKQARSTKNWRWELQTRLANHNKSKEVLLERAIAKLAKAGHLRDWTNQIPAISGLVSDLNESRAAVDLARLSDSKLELIELKWDSDTPTYAAFEIVLYGLAYIYCRAHRVGGERRVMQADKIALRVLAPEARYRKKMFRDLEAGLSQGFEAVLRAQLSPALSGDFRFLQFPSGFVPPFKCGADVSAACNQEVLGPIAEAYCEIVRHRTRPVYA